MTSADRSGPDPRALESLLAFWADAGVDAMVSDAPVDRMAAPPQRPAPPAAERRPAASPRPAAGPAPATAADSLDALAAAVAAFDGCALRSAGSARAVFAHLPAHADVVVVAEAPGAEDEAQGAPFSGPAGVLVRTLLRHAGLGDRAVLTQTVFWRPPGGAAPSAVDQAACLPFLERLIALARPKAVLVMGESASRALLGVRDPILRSRGGWTSWSGAHEALTLPAMPTLAPAFALARPAMRAALWGDILSLAARVDPGGTGA